MIIHDRSFPHPVLASFRDDVTPNDFALQFTVTADADNFYLDLKFSYSNPTLVELVKGGKAFHAVHLECKRNFYREIFLLKDLATRLTIKTAELVGRVEVSGFISAHTTLDDYQIQGAHLDYDNSRFQVRPGDILAVCPTETFDAFVDYDPLKSISSILTIRRSEALDEGAMKLETTDDKIIVTLSKTDYDRYVELKADPAIGPLLANQVVVPALLEAIHEIKETSEDDFEDGMAKRWFRSIYKKLKDSGMDLHTKSASALDALQLLLKLPLRRSLEGLIRLDPMDETP
jgi:hypothetical protein